MNFTQSFRLAIKSLRTSKMRAFLTMLGIVIGVGAVIVIISLGNGLQRMVDQQVENMGVNLIQTMIYGRGDGTTMNLDPDEMYQLVEEHPDVLSGVSPYVSTNAPLRSGDTLYERTSIYGVSEIMYKQDTHATLDGETLAQGRFIQYIDVERAQNVCVIGAFLAQDAFDGDALGKTIKIGGVPYTVVGVLSQSGDTLTEGGRDDQVYIPYENALKIMGNRYVPLYMFTSTSRDTAAAAKEVIDAKLYEFFQDDNAHDHGGAGDHDQCHDGHRHAGAGGHRGDFPAGGRHRHYEHHAGVRDGTDPGDRNPEIPGGQAAGHPQPVHHRGGHHIRHRGTAGHCLWLSGSHGSWHADRRRAGIPDERQRDLQCDADVQRSGGELWRQRGNRRAVWISPGQ